jgi:DNA-binding SARP family transcriptional activator/pimeloyl-ACP methyl ester carboxylesterase
MHAVVEVAVLGPLRVVVAGRELGPGDLGGRRPKQVLELLLLHDGQPVTKERIADLLWGERLPKDWARTLEANVSVLRARLSSDRALARRIVVTEPGAYRVASELATVDAHRFDELLAAAATASERSARLELLEEALTLVRGNAFADEPYAEWAFAFRRLYAERVLGARLDLADESLAVGDAQSALLQAQAVLAEDATRERAHRILMLCHYTKGDQAAALRAFADCRTALDQEVGVAPLPETEALRFAIAGHEPPGLLLSTRPAGVADGMRGHTRYVKVGPSSLAYQVFGSGPVDLVLVQGFVTNVEVCWEWPAYGSFLRRLARMARVIMFDRRGVGMSDPVEHLYEPGERVMEITAVMDATGSDRAVLFGISEGAPLSIQLATEHPERVAGLVLYGSFARAIEQDGKPGAWSMRRLDLFLAGIEASWATGYAGEVAHPSTAGDPMLRDWIARYVRLGASPGMARALMQMNAALDVTDLLSVVDAPTLVVHRADEGWIPPAAGRAVAEGISGARFELVPGGDHWPWVGDSEPILDLIDRFLAVVTSS